MTDAARKLNTQPEMDDSRDRGIAIDPCELCSHQLYLAVDPRCKTCGLRGRRFFEVIHASKIA